MTEGDANHSDSNKAKMAEGIPLTDEVKQLFLGCAAESGVVCVSYPAVHVFVVLSWWWVAVFRTLAAIFLQKHKTQHGG